jgi:hypothetical protein
MLNDWLPCKIPFNREIAVGCCGTRVVRFIWEEFRERVMEESEDMHCDLVSSGPSPGEGDDDRERKLETKPF